MITLLEMLEQLKTVETLNLGQIKHGQVELWTEVINAAIPEVTSSQVRAAVMSLAGTRSTEARGQFITPKDVIDAINQESSVLLAAKRERLKQEIAHNGQFQALGLTAIEDAALEVQWRQAATKAFLNGATREQAEQHAWQQIGRAQPAIEPTEQHAISTDQIGR